MSNKNEKEKKKKKRKVVIRNNRTATIIDKYNLFLLELSSISMVPCDVKHLMIPCRTTTEWMRFGKKKVWILKAIFLVIGAMPTLCCSMGLIIRTSYTWVARLLWSNGPWPVMSSLSSCKVQLAQVTSSSTVLGSHISKMWPLVLNINIVDKLLSGESMNERLETDRWLLPSV